jgi:4,5-dihydroxyphthalate decarboxylase
MLCLIGDRIRRMPAHSEITAKPLRALEVVWATIMHTVVIRKDIYELTPWVALSLYRAFSAAKQRCYQALLETGSPKATFGWLQAMIEEEQSIFGRDWFPYGVEKNRSSLDALLQFNHEQGLTQRRIAIEELFAESTLREVPLGEGQFL